MVSKSQIKLITGLRLKKYRDKHKVFVAEGPKVIGELIDCGWNPQLYFSTREADYARPDCEQIPEKMLAKMSSLKAPNASLAVFSIPQGEPILDTGLIVALDTVRDPGNLGTIIRLCDWFGVSHLLCSHETVDCYNPKVIQATAGSIARVHVHYLDLEEFLTTTKLPVYVTCLAGASVYSRKLPEVAVLVLGNEANGVSSTIMDQASKKVTIPQFGIQKDTESLNVATAAAILLSEFRRAIER